MTEKAPPQPGGTSSDGRLIGCVVGKYFELGPDKKPDFNGIDRNIREAVRWSRTLVLNGFPVFTPHLNTFHFEMRTRIDPDPIQNEEFFRAFDRRMLCEAMALPRGRTGESRGFVFATPNWRRSSGGRLEVQLASHLGIPVFETIDDLKAWNSGNSGYATVRCDEISDEALNFGAKDVPIVVLLGRNGSGRVARAAGLHAVIDEEVLAEETAISLFNNKIAAFTPQMNNSVRRLGLQKPNLFASLTKAVLERVADALFLLDGTEDDPEAREIACFAAACVRRDGGMGKPVFTSFEELLAWRDATSALAAGAASR